MRLKITKFRLTFLVAITLAVSVLSIDTAFCASKSELLVPDYEAINLAIHNKDSENFYPKIFERYMNGDTTLTLNNYHHLYYGYSFNEGYNPIEVNPMKDSLMIVMQRNRDQNFISPEIFDDMERIAAKSLGYNPFDIGVLNILSFIYSTNGNDQKARSFNHRVNMIKDVILASGDGVSKNSPFHVISRNEEEAVLASLGAEYTKRMYISIDVEYFQLKQRYKNAKGLYFNIGRIWTKMPDEREKPERRFELNPYQNPKSKRFISPLFK